jgi:hypothetical protein
LIRCAVVAVAAAAALAACSSNSTHAAVPARRAPTPTVSASPTPSQTAGPKGRFGFPLATAGIHVDPAVLRLGRAEHVDVLGELRGTELRVLKVLRGHPVHIAVRLDDRALVPEIGVGGDTGVNESVVIDVEPGAPAGTRATLHDWLPFVLAHELDHVVRFQDGPGIIGTVLDNFVSEGVADAFAAATFPQLPPSPTDTGLTPAQLHHYWQLAQDIIYQFPSRRMHEQWMFGGGGFPHNTGYAIGYALVRSMRAHHPHVSWAALTRMDGETLLEMSRFNPSRVAAGASGGARVLPTNDRGRCARTLKASSRRCLERLLVGRNALFRPGALGCRRTLHRG